MLSPECLSPGLLVRFFSFWFFVLPFMGCSRLAAERAGLASPSQHAPHLTVSSDPTGDRINLQGGSPLAMAPCFCRA